MMQSKVKRFKSNLNGALIMALVVGAFAKALQTPKDTLRIAPNELQTEVRATMKKMDSVKKTGYRILVDGVSGVVGDYVILKSDVAIAKEDLKRSQSMMDIPQCDLIKSMLREKMFAHHAIQDSIIVSDGEIYGRVDQTVEYFLSQVKGDEKRLLELYKKNSMEDLRTELYNINRDQLLSARMQERLTEGLEITPEEVREFFYSLPEDERPLFNTEVELAQIIINAVPTDEAEKEVVDKLNEFRTDILENGASFAAKAVLYSEDPGSSNNGGMYSLKRTDAFVKPFKDAAFSLQEGEVSEPFKSEFGWHILTVDKIRGQVRDVRHILLVPFVSTAQMNAAKEKLSKVRDSVLYGDLTFDEAARKYSDEKETAKNGGKLIDPRTGESRLELTRMAEQVTSQVQFLEKGDISSVVEEKDRTGKVIGYKIVYMVDKINDHQADYSLDYLKIKDIALNNKRAEVIEEWQKEKLKDTYIKIGEDFQGCESLLDWTR